MYRGSFRKIVEGAKVDSLKSLGGGGGGGGGITTSLALIPHAVFTSSNGGKVLASGCECPPPPPPPHTHTHTHTHLTKATYIAFVI